MLSGKKRILMAVLLLISLFALSSCSKHNGKISGKDDNSSVDEAAVSDSDFTESNEDLLTVDYKKFYDELSPHGEWVKVSAKELGINLKNGESSGESSSLLNDLIGIKDAHADVGFGFFFVWKPSPNLAISVSAGEPAVYVPYTRGRWVYTDYGWYFRAPTPYEEITCHYGRWAYDPVLGWVWIPGRVWAPAWVEWRDDDDYIAWTPLPPSVYIVNGVCPPVVIDDDRYVVCERRYFIDPGINSHCLFYHDFHDRIHIRDMHRLNGVMVENHRVFDNGPDYKRIGTIAGRNIEPVRINKVSNMDNVKYSRNEMNVYSPHFSRIKGNVKNENVIKPDKFVPYDHVQNRFRNERTNHAGPVNDNNGRQSVHKGMKMKPDEHNNGNNQHFMGGNRNNGFNKKNNERNNNRGFEKFRKSSGNHNNQSQFNRKQYRENRNYNKPQKRNSYNQGSERNGYNRSGYNRNGYKRQGHTKQDGNRSYRESRQRQNNNSGYNSSRNERKKQQNDRGSNSHGRGKR